MTAPTVTSLLKGFFTARLTRQLQASPQTISAYRDTIKLLLMFAAKKTKKAPSRLMIDDLDAVTVGAFLSYLDDERHNSTATHNARLAAIHSFYRYALPLIPDRAHTASQVLAIPQRRHDRAIVSYLTSCETDALLAAADRTTWYGRRDHALLLTTVQTGLRVSEVTGLRIQDITTTTATATTTSVDINAWRGLDALIVRGAPRRVSGWEQLITDYANTFGSHLSGTIPHLLSHMSSICYSGSLDLGEYLIHCAGIVAEDALQQVLGAIDGDKAPPPRHRMLNPLLRLTVETKPQPSMSAGWTLLDRPIGQTFPIHVDPVR
jgi:hypothetical protein